MLISVLGFSIIFKGVLDFFMGCPEPLTEPAKPSKSISVTFHTACFKILLGLWNPIFVMIGEYKPPKPRRRLTCASLQRPNVVLRCVFPIDSSNVIDETEIA